MNVAVREERVFEIISEAIRSSIASGLLRPGDKLSSERDLAEKYGASRAAVREALRSLERGGLIEQRKGPKGGTFVRLVDNGLVTQSLNDAITFGGVSIQSLTESRTIVMTSVVRLACERGTDADFDGMLESIARTEEYARSGDLDARRLQLLDFYQLLGHATRNDVMVILVSVLTDLALKLMTAYDIGPRSRTIQTHRKLVRCLRERDADEAVALMAGHLNKMHAYFRKSALAKRASGRLQD